MSSSNTCSNMMCDHCQINMRVEKQEHMEARARLDNCEKEKRQLEAQLAREKSKSRELEASIGNYKKKVQELKDELKVGMIEKDMVIHELEDKLVASQEEKARKIQELQEQHAKDIGGKILKIQTLELELSAVQKKSCEKILELQEQNTKKLSEKDLKIQQLEIKLAAAKKEISEKELEKPELSKKFDAQEQLEKMFAKNTEMPDHVEKPKSNLQEKKSDEPTQLHIDLGKLYVELQEAKKPQEALMAQLAAKDKEMEYLTKQHETELVAKDQEITNLREQHTAKLAAKDSEVQRLTEMVQDGDEKNENLQEIIYKLQKMMDAKDREIGAMKKRVAGLEAELENGRGGQSE